MRCQCGLASSLTNLKCKSWNKTQVLMMLENFKGRNQPCTNHGESVNWWTIAKAWKALHFICLHHSSQITSWICSTTLVSMHDFKSLSFSELSCDNNYKSQNDHADILIVKIFPKSVIPFYTGCKCQGCFDFIILHLISMSEGYYKTARIN